MKKFIANLIINSLFAVAIFLMVASVYQSAGLLQTILISIGVMALATIITWAIKNSV